MTVLKMNSAFRRALMALSHPISIAALIIVLLNDHWWRRVAPSWITGKIGDFAWLIFAPFLLAAILAWLPIRSRNRANLIGYGSIIAVGMIFGLAKTVPEFHALTIKVLETLTGWPNILRIDPTDLIALPALFITVWIWRRSATRSFHLPNRGWVLLPLAVLATMADSPAQDFGICDFKVAGSIITTRQFTSQDGGLTWEGSSGGYGNYCETHRGQWLLPDPTEAQTQYRFTPGVSVERSSDGGQSWTKEIDLNGDDARTTYIGKTGQLFYAQLAGPVAAVIHQPTGNVIAAMGHEGALVRTPDGTWRWVAVGEYHLPDLQRVDNVVVLLSGEFLFALLLIALFTGTLLRRFNWPAWRELITLIGVAAGWGVWAVVWIRFVDARDFLTVLVLAYFILCVRLLFAGPHGAYFRAMIRPVLKGAAWWGWIFAVLSQPARAYGYGNMMMLISVAVITILTVPLLLSQLVNMIRSNRRALLPTILFAILAAALYLLPFVVWSQGGIPFYSTAALYALALVAATLIAGQLYLKRYHPLATEGRGDARISP